MDGLYDILVWDLRKDEEYVRLDARVSATPIPQNGGGGSLAFSPDGKYLAIGTGYPYNGSAKRSDLKVWRVSEMKEEIEGKIVFKNDHVLSDVKFSPDSAYLIATDHAGVLRIWNTQTWELERQWDNGSSSSALAISTDGQMLATGASGQTILWDFATGEKLRVLSGASPWSLDFSPDGRTLVSGSRNHNVILWDVATGMQQRTFHAHSDAVKGVAFSPSGNTLATIGSEGVLRLWDAASIEEIDNYPPTWESLLRLGQLRNREDQFVQAETILRRLLEQHRDQLDDSIFYEIREELTKSLDGQGKMPKIKGDKTSSIESYLGETVSLSVDVGGDGPWSYQWFRNGNKMEGATARVLKFDLKSEEDLGSYYVQVAPVGEEDIDGVASSWIHVYESRPNPNQGLIWETFQNIPGKGLAELTNSKKFLENNPDKTEIIDTFDIPRNTGDNYGGRLTGLLTVPKTGNYKFYLCSGRSIRILSESR